MLIGIRSFYPKIGDTGFDDFFLFAKIHKSEFCKHPQDNHADVVRNRPMRNYSFELPVFRTHCQPEPDRILGRTDAHLFSPDFERSGGNRVDAENRTGYLGSS